MRVTTDARVEEHYTSGDLIARIEAALLAAGKDPAALRSADIAGFEEFHIRGRAATRELGALLGLAAGERVLDVGCGVGGPARTLAVEFGCRVTGIDLVAEYCAAASWLTERVGLAGQVEFRQANALALPFAANSFDAVVLEHVSMNIADKPALFAELRRVLRPGGRLGLYEVCAGAGEPHYPVPWASEPGISFLVGPDSLRAATEAAGFAPLQWRDVSAPSLEWLQQTAAARTSQGRDARDPLVPGLLMGSDAGKKAANVARNLREGRIALIEASFRAL